jgi:toxin-antitoxin system, toxin component, relE family
MRIFTEQVLKEYIAVRPEVKTALQEWVMIVKQSQWTCFADIKATFNSVDSIGNQRYVFNIKGNKYRLVVVIKFTIKFVYIRFIGTHTEYDKIDCSTIKN